MCGHCDNETLPSTAANLYTKCSIQNNRKCLEKQNNILTIVANQMIPITKFLLNDLLPTFVCKLVNLISLSLLCSLKWTVKSIFFHVCRHENHFYQIAFFVIKARLLFLGNYLPNMYTTFFTLWSNETDNSNRSEL
jgi:hypothetical protein